MGYHFALQSAATMTILNAMALLCRLCRPPRLRLLGYAGTHPQAHQPKSQNVPKPLLINLGPNDTASGATLLPRLLRSAKFHHRQVARCLVTISRTCGVPKLYRCGELKADSPWRPPDLARKKLSHRGVEMSSLGRLPRWAATFSQTLITHILGEDAVPVPWDGGRRNSILRLCTDLNPVKLGK